MRLTVLLFASLRELAALDRLDLEIADGADLAALETVLLERWPDFAQVPFVFALNQELVDKDHKLAAGDEVALIPAISGGAGHLPTSFSFTHERIDRTALEETVASDHDGAQLCFYGVTRAQHDGKKVTGLAYEAFEAMAASGMEAILSEVFAEHELSCILVQHRLGEVPIGEVSIAVIITAEHRGDCFDACRIIMDRVKRELPIFKKERYVNESAAWIGDLPEGRD